MICKECKLDKKILAKGLCSFCYRAQYIPGKFKAKPKPPKKIKPTHCAKCDKESYLIKGLCRSCYNKKMRAIHEWSLKIGKCILCKRDNVKLVSEDRCSTCYQRIRRDAGFKTPPKHKPCKVCGQPGFKQAFCEEHYKEHLATAEQRKKDQRNAYYQKNRDKLLTLSKQHHKANSDIYSQRASEWAKQHPEIAKERTRIQCKKWYQKHKHDPKYVARQRAASKRKYDRMKDDPDFKEKNRIRQRAYHERKKNEGNT